MWIVNVWVNSSIDGCVLGVANGPYDTEEKAIAAKAYFVRIYPYFIRAEVTELASLPLLNGLSAEEINAL